MRRNVRVGMVAGTVAMALTGVAQADFINFDESNFFSFENTGAAFSGTWTYTFIGGTSGTLQLVLSNDNSLTLAGAITAIAFNNPDGVTLGGFSYTQTGGDVEAFALDGAIPRPGSVGHFNSVYSVDGLMFTGAGSGMEGIEVGEEATFSWTVTSASASGLSVSNFLDFDLNDPDNPGGQFAMALKFKGLGPEDLSDTFVLIPLPAALPMGLVGLAGVAALRYRSRSARRKKPAMV